MQFSGKGSSLELGLGTGGESSTYHGQQPPDVVWDLSNNPNYGFLGHVPNVSQLGLSRLYAENEFRKATITPHVVRVHSVVEYHRTQDEPGVTLPLFHGTGEVSVAEITRPYHPHALLQGDRLVLSTERPDYLQNNMALPLGDPPIVNNDLMNKANKHREFPKVADQAVDPWSLPKVDVYRPTADYNDEHNEVPMEDDPIDAEPLRVYMPADSRDGNNILRPKVETNNDGNLDPTSVAISERRCNYRRTRSLPYTKYGPYTCPRCMDVFPTSQSFAAHVSAHYRRDGDSAVREGTVSIQNAARKRGRAGRRIPYVRTGPYPCRKCNLVLETPHMFATHITSHYMEEVIQGLSGDAANGLEKEIPTTTPLEEAVDLVPMVDWMAKTLKKVLLNQHRKRSSVAVPATPPPPPPPPDPSSSSSSSAPREAGAAAVKMEFEPEDEEEVVEVDAIGLKIKKEPWST